MLRSTIFRRRSNSCTRSCAGATVLAVILAIYYCLVHFWANPKSPGASTIISNQYVVPIIAAAISYLFSQFRAVRSRAVWLPPFLLPLPKGEVWKRSILRRQELDAVFDADDSCRTTVEDGWKMRGSASAPASSIEYRKLIDRPFSIIAQFYAKARFGMDSERYWRYGFMVLKGDREAVCFHLDDQNRLVGRVDGNTIIKTVTDVGVSNSWQLLQLAVSEVGGGRLVFHGIYQDRTYLLGSSAYPGEARLKIRGWSDEHSSHEIDVRDISVSVANP